LHRRSTTMSHWCRGVLMLMVGVLLGCSAQPADTADAVGRVLVRVGDLPAGVRVLPVQVAAEGVRFADIPTSDWTRYQEFQTTNGSYFGEIAVLHYVREAERDAAFTQLVEDLGSDAYRLPIGEVGWGQDATAAGLSGDADVIFVRCGAVVFVRYTGPT